MKVHKFTLTRIEVEIKIIIQVLFICKTLVPHREDVSTSLMSQLYIEIEHEPTNLKVGLGNLTKPNICPK